MSYVKMSVEREQLFLELDKRKVKASWPLSAQKTQQLINQIKSIECSVQGISAEVPTASKEILNTTFKQLGKELSESLNCPISYLIGGGREIKEDSWTLSYYGYNPGADEYAAESLLTTGNGFIGLRGTTTEMKISEDHYPATYLAGLYNETSSEVSGKEISNEDFVNAPNLQYLTVSVGDEKITFSKEQVKELERHLDLRTGLFFSQAVVRTSAGKELLIKIKKIVSMADRHQYAISYQVTPLNFSGEITLVSEADGDVCNYNVARYRSLNGRHLVLDEIKIADNQARLVAHTSTSDLTIVQESKLLSDNKLVWHNKITNEKAIQQSTVIAAEGQRIIVEKLVFVDTLTAKSNLYKTSGADKLSSFEEMFLASIRQWLRLWQEADIEIDGDMMSQRMLRLHTYHLLVSASPLATPDLDVSVTARGLHGEAYRGHIFWDELYILPFYILHFPDTAKGLLMYRYHRLNAAKKAAKAEGFYGAMYPWQSGLDGSEQSQVIHLNPMSGKWDADNSRLQRHVSLAIAYNVWLYYKNTDDVEFIDQYGLEMLLEITKFWISIAKYDDGIGKYSIEGVMGPDEFHEAYPGSKKGGLKDNAYTNMMVTWLFHQVKELLETLPDRVTKTASIKTSFHATLLAQLEQIMHRLHLQIDDDGVIAQFAGYFELQEIDWKYYKDKYGDIQRMDRILRAEGHSADDYQVAKQADSLMVFYNLDQKHVDQVLCDLNYQLPKDYFQKNLDYYLSRTSHGSTLSRVVHAQLIAMAGDNALSWQKYQEALFSDYHDIQGGTTAEGIHTGVMAATVYITLRIYGGIDMRGDMLEIDPDLPVQWDRMAFNLYNKGIHYRVIILTNKLKITADQNTSIMIGGHKVELNANQEKVMELI